MKNRTTLKTDAKLNSDFISIQDCLKMIGMKEVSANIYSLPKKSKK